MMKLFRNLLSIIAFLISQFLFAQANGLSGSLIDQKEESLPFATVAVLKLPDSTVVTGTTTEMDGSFIMDTPEKGEFLLRFSAIGFESTFTEPFKVEGKDFRRNFGVITMNESVTMLNEVMIKTWRPRVKVENGKMIMKVEGTAIASGSNAYEMLSRAPGVAVGQNGEFLINGMKGVTVMIDDRLTYLSAKELQTFLESTPAENIEEIEVITNPSAKYDAEGTGGILNIKLKKSQGTGFNASVYGGYKVNHQNLFNTGANLSFSKGKWHTFANISISENGLYRPQKVKRTFDGNQDYSVYEQQGLQIRERLVNSLQAGADYDLGPRNTIGFLVNMAYQDGDSEWNSETNLLDDQGNNFVNVQALNSSGDQRFNGQFNLHYTHELDTLGTSISTDLDYARVTRDSESRFLNTYKYSEDNSTIIEPLESNSISDYDIYAAKIDFTRPLSERSSLEMGVKASKVISDSDLKYYITEDNEQKLDPSNSNQFRYEEEIYAAYVSYSNRLSETWNLHAGLRAEKTIGEGRSFTLNQSNERDYLNFFPNVMLEQKVSENYKLNYSYNRRITRPNYSVFNPFIFYLDPYSYVVGNSDLQPDITNSFKVSQTFYKKFHLMLSYESSDNYFTEVPSIDPETGETVYTTGNVDNYSTYVASLVAPVELATFWNVNNTLVFNQQNYDLLMEDQIVESNNLFYMFQSNHQVNLPFDVKLEVNGTYRGPYASGIYDVDRQWWIDAGLKKSFLNDRLDLTLNVNDIFKGQEMDINAQFFGNEIQINQYFDNRKVSINLRYTFSRSNSKRKARESSLEELNRAGA